MAGTALGDLTWPGAGRAARGGAVLAVPIGATEQHGPHLPLSTDTDIAQALAAGLVARRAGVVAAPPLAYGSSGEHDGFAGTLSIGRDAVEHLLVELGRSASATFGQLLLISAHGGNHVPVHRARQRLRDEGRAVEVFAPRWAGDAHAGRVETSLMLAIAPGRVRLEHAAAGATAALPELLPRLVAGGVRAVSANGVLGDPAGASAAEGRRLLAAALDDLEAVLDGWA